MEVWGVAGKDGKALIACRVILISDLLILQMVFYTQSANTPAWLVVQSIILALGPCYGFLIPVNEILEKQKAVSSDGCMEMIEEEIRAKEA